MFAGGTAQALLTMLWWAWELGIRQYGLAAPGWPWPPAWLHAGVMIFGLFPWFAFGFLMTALPKWMAAPPLACRRYLPPFFLMAAGWVAFWGGLAWPPLALAGLLLAVAGWSLATLALGRVAMAAAGERAHALAAVMSLAAGAAAFLAWVGALARTDAALFRLAVEGGLWLGLAPLFFVVLHRMLPFFTAAAIRPYVAYQPLAALWLMLAAFAAHGLLAGTEAESWRWPPDLLAAALAWHFCWRWSARAAYALPMLAMLHLGLLWLPVALSLYALQGMLAAMGVSWGGLAPLHALGIGFFASILLGMATRVTLGHSGRPIAGDRWAWRLFRLLQLVVLLRLAGEFAAGASLLAAAGWLLVFGAWAAVHFPMYLRPRPDGQPG